MMTGLMFTAATHTFISSSLLYDQTLPITNLVQIPVSPTVKAGETFQYVARFDKRIDCKVTGGGYSIKGTTADGKALSRLEFITATYGTWPAGKNQTVKAGVGIPGDIPAGNYIIWWKYCWQCSGARGVLCVPPERELVTAMPVKVVR